jgi:hypothetical protein
MDDDKSSSQDTFLKDTVSSGPLASPTSLVVHVAASTTPLVLVSFALVTMHFYFKLTGPFHQRKLIWWDDFCVGIAAVSRLFERAID